MSTVLSDGEIRQALQQLPGWKQNGKALERIFQFDNFVKAMEFVNQIAEAAEAVNHHPDILINYSKVTLTLVSHDSGGVTQRDLEMAARINEWRPPERGAILRLTNSGESETSRFTAGSLHRTLQGQCVPVGREMAHAGLENRARLVLDRPFQRPAAGYRRACSRILSFAGDEICRRPGRHS